MANSSHEQGWSARRAEVARQYSDAIEKAVADQRDFVSTNLFTETGYLHGLTGFTGQLQPTYNRQYGLHAETDGAAVSGWAGLGAPLDGLWKIDYDDNCEHWETPLLTALVDERVAVADQLLAQGADVDAANYFVDLNGGTLAHTALHMMVARGAIHHVRRLVRAGADVNRQTSDGTTPLSLAAADDNREITGLLLDARADPTVEDFVGRCPADRAGVHTRDLLL